MPLRGPLSITVPGAVRSWADAHRRFGLLSVAEVLAPAIELARDGFPAWDGFIEAVEATAPLVAEAIGPNGGFLGRLPAAWAGVAFRASASGCQPWLPRSRRSAREGFDAFYDGDLADPPGPRARGRGLPDRRRPTSPRTGPTGAIRSRSTIGASG